MGYWSNEFGNTYVNGNPLVPDIKTLQNRTTLKSEWKNEKFTVIYI